jgi:hypothetical protein
MVKPIGKEMMMFDSPRGCVMIKRWVAAILLIFAVVAATEVYGRNGQSADDCPPGSKDPDCAGSK